MATVSNRIKDTFSNARQQLEGFEKMVEGLEKRAKESFDDVPGQLRGAWENVVERLRHALDFATRVELRELSARVDELAKKVDKLLRADKIRTAAGAKDKAPLKRA
jgi:hypothetical protein